MRCDMMRPMPRKQVLLQLTDELLTKLDALAGQTGRSRSAMVRDAVERYVAKESEAEKDRRLIEGYSRNPPDDEFDDLAEAAARRLFEEESW
jgi:metal-responsive CopG/Arc/MetJ family transcriptional regulator